MWEEYSTLSILFARQIFPYSAVASSVENMLVSSMKSTQKNQSCSQIAISHPHGLNDCRFRRLLHLDIHEHKKTRWNAIRVLPSQKRYFLKLLAGVKIFRFFLASDMVDVNESCSYVIKNVVEVMLLNSYPPNVTIQFCRIFFKHIEELAPVIIYLSVNAHLLCHPGPFGRKVAIQNFILTEILFYQPCPHWRRNI